MGYDRVSLHMLTAFPPSCPNSDDLGQPKTAVVGGRVRQRISSQCLKRVWRFSESLRTLEGRFSTRTRELGPHLLTLMKAGGMAEKDALRRTIKIVEQFGSIDKKRSPATAEVVAYGHEEWAAAESLARCLGKENRNPTEAELSALAMKTTSIDCALFGRMRAARTDLCVDAAVAVSHSLTVNANAIEADYWTSVDDFKVVDRTQDLGAAHIGYTEFGAGIYYTFVDIAVNALRENLGHGREVAPDVVAALIQAMATEVPGGQKARFGHVVRAAYLRAECGAGSGNLFCSAFNTPVVDMRSAIDTLRVAADREAAAYSLSRLVTEFSVPDAQGSLGTLVASVREAFSEST